MQLSKNFSLSMILVMSDTLYIVYDNFEAIKEVSCMCYMYQVQYIVPHAGRA